MKYFVNITTGALMADWIAPTYRAYWKEITKKEYDKLCKEYYKQKNQNRGGEKSAPKERRNFCKKF